jgi:hypothetical protein
VAFALTIDVGSVPAARNPYPDELSSLDNRIFAAAYGVVDNSGQDAPVYLTWDTAGNVTVTPAPLPEGPSLAASGDANANTIQVVDPSQQVQVGMRAFGGFLTNDGKHGNAMPNFAIVIAAGPPQTGGDGVTRRQVTLNGRTLVAVNDNVQFSNTAPDLEVTGPSTTLQLPTDRPLKSVRIVFAIGGHPWLDTAAAGAKAPTVHDDPYYAALAWDFAEFTMDATNGVAT